jgi:hypothetical protein
MTRFEGAWSDENIQNVAVLQSTGRDGGTLLRYEVRWKYSLLDDGETYSSYESWARLAPLNLSRGDPADAGFLVAAASAEHHKLR